MAPHQYSSFTLIYHVDLAYNHCLEKECLHFRQLVRSVHSRIVNTNNVAGKPRRIHQILHILHEGHGIQAQIEIQYSFGVGFDHEYGELSVNEHWILAIRRYSAITASWRLPEITPGLFKCLRTCAIGRSQNHE